MWMRCASVHPDSMYGALSKNEAQWPSAREVAARRRASGVDDGSTQTERRLEPKAEPSAEAVRKSGEHVASFARGRGRGE
eukprot:3107707-Pleurochrysis_carterae.AAC.1